MQQQEEIELPSYEDIETRLINVGDEEHEVIKFNLENVKRYLDASIGHWRMKLKNETSAHKKTQYSGFIESHQILRKIIFGRCLDS
jgi:hypothetical protein